MKYNDCPKSYCEIMLLLCVCVCVSVYSKVDRKFVDNYIYMQTEQTKRTKKLSKPL